MLGPPVDEAVMILGDAIAAPTHWVSGGMYIGLGVAAALMSGQPKRG
jgi:hypothetical protein